MVILRDEDGHARPIGRVGEAPVHLEVAGDGSKVFGKLSQVKIKVRRVELDPRQKEVGCLISMLIGEKDVAVWRKMNSAIEATTPLRSGQETRRMAESFMDISSGGSRHLKTINH